MRVFKTKSFAAWADEEGLSDEGLLNAVTEMEDGLVDANLGGSVYKKRVAIGDRGKSGGLRTLLAFKKVDKAFYIYGFAKNQRANISDKELKALKKLAKELLGYNDKELQVAVAARELTEVVEQ